ncbi:hypothetical protein OSB04_009138 [Centaurea solstitialis]|uniref:Transcription and mRNA export factor ENY2 n=1 Tax=Centaurea solstitialis TaxID=347529 RepID=A0AA38U7L5_9ASTR|nr:hypothetical protein OSB04_009138 [Centaurea solstitialis]
MLYDKKPILPDSSSTMDAAQIDLERLMIFEHARMNAEAEYLKNPTDADNLTRWGGALLELSQFGDINESRKMLQDAVSKLDEALAINPAKHEALWCLGNAHTAKAFLTPDHDEAQIQFEQAFQCFQKAVEEGMNIISNLWHPVLRRASIKRPPTPDAEDEDEDREPTLQEIINIKLIESGEKERLKELLRERLTECGWKDEMKSLCRSFTRKKGRNNVTVDDLVHLITPKGRAAVPDSNLTRWGGALLELSQFGDINESRKMLQDAVSKLDEALAINPAKHEALWCLGNAHTAKAFLTPDYDEAQIQFEQAFQCFQKAVEECPGNEHYLQSLASCAKAPELHKEIHKHGGLGQGQQALGGGPGASSSAKKANKSSDLKYDIFGWIILAAGLVAWVGMAKSNAPPPPPR